jgi:hypothetical protein
VTDTKKYSWPFNEPFYGSVSGRISTEVPQRYEVGINGRGYMLDLASQAFINATVPLSRAQLDVGQEPSESSLSRDAFWRRSWESWHHGTGQRFRDRSNSDRYRYRDSRGLDVWVRDRLGLLRDTDRVVTSTNTNLFLTTLGGYAYVADGGNVLSTTDGTTWTAVSGLSGSLVRSIVNDGQYVYATDGANIFRATPGGAFTSWNPLDVGLLGWVNGRLMAAGYGATQNALYNILDATGPPAHFTHPSTAWTWTAFATGPNSIFAAGYVGDTSFIYRIPMKTDGTGLDVPLVSFEFPEGEQCLTLTSYLGYLVAGTSVGLRLIDMGESLTAGPPVTVGAVRCVEPQDRYVWFGWSNYDTTHTGLGRASLVPGIDSSAFTDSLTPAYASDLMAAVGTQGNVVSVASYQGRRIFAVAGNGVWLESPTRLVPDGWVTTGWITFGLPDNKVIESVDLRMMPLAGTITLALSTESTPPETLSPVVDTQGTTSALVSTRERLADRFELLITLTRDGPGTQGPLVNRLTMFANPAPTRTAQWQLPLLLAETVALVPQNTSRHYFARVERQLIGMWCESGQLVTIQVGIDNFNATISDWEWHPTHRYNDNTDWNGTLLVTLKQPAKGET